jgi:FKBP-type peptidyl-prolyl cis-trans isomerase FklB
MAEIINLVPESLSAHTGKEKASYCLGLDAGNSIRLQFSDMDTQLLITGFEDAIKRNRPRVTEEEFQTIMTSVKQQMEAQQKAFVGQLSQKNKKQSESFLEKNKSQEGVTTLPSGLQYKVLTQGFGPQPELTDLVKVHYKGTFIDGQLFDSSYQRGEPARFPVNRVIAGWSEALQLMPTGSKWQIFVPGYLAYGEAGFAPHIEPNKLLIFEMELLEINPEN